MLNALRLAVFMALAPLAAQAADDTRHLRLIGEMPPGRDDAPTQVILEIDLTPTGEAYQMRVEGWLAALAPEADGHGVDGACVEARCVINANLGYRQIAITGDFAADTPPTEGRYVWDADNENPLKGVIKLRVLTGDAPGLGAFAPVGAIGRNELSNLLAWAGLSPGFSNDYEDGPPGDSERTALSVWQGANGRPGSGLLLAADIAALRAQAQEQRNTLGWENLKADGWTGGYPALMLPKATPEPNGRRFSTPTGEAHAVFAFDPPMTEEAWDAFVEARTAEREGRESRGYTRVNSDMEINYVEGGSYVAEVYHRREKGVARMVLTYPATETENWATPEAVMVRNFRAEGD